jgi:hypothetical protein
MERGKAIVGGINYFSTNKFNKNLINLVTQKNCEDA